MPYNLKKIRESKKLTQTQVASVIGVTYQALGLYEREKAQPDPKTLCSLADYFGVTVDYLLGREPESGLIYLHKDPALTDREREVLKAFHSVPPALQQKALQMLRCLGDDETTQQ